MTDSLLSQNACGRPAAGYGQCCGRRLAAAVLARRLGLARADLGSARWKALEWMLQHLNLTYAERILRGFDEVARCERDEFIDGLDDHVVFVWEDKVKVEVLVTDEACELDPQVFRQVLADWIEFLRWTRR